MPLEQQLTSLPLSQKLREMGVPQEVSRWHENPELKRPASIFVYTHPWQKYKAVPNKTRWIITQPLNLNGRHFICAYSVPELLAIINKPMTVPPHGSADFLAEYIISSGKVDR